MTPPPADGSAKATGTARKRAVALAAGAMAAGLAGNTLPEGTAPFSVSDLVRGWSYDFDLSTNPRYTRQHAAVLSVSDPMKRAMAQEEGLRLTVYRDIAGYPTVGIGHKVTPDDGLAVGDRISRRRAMAFLAHDIRRAERSVRRLAGDLPLFQHEYDALVDLVYNIGAGGAGPEESPRLNAAIADRDYVAIADELTYGYARGRKAGGLVQRSERRTQIFLLGDYDNPRLDG